MKTRAWTRPIWGLVLAAAILLGSPALPASAAEVNLAYQPGPDNVNTVKVSASYRNSVDSIPEAAFDNQKSDSSGKNKWNLTASNADGAWICVDLGALYQVASMKVYSSFADNSAKDVWTDFEVYYSTEALGDAEDASKFQLLTSVAGAGAAPVLTFDATEMRTVKLVSRTKTAFRVREIEIYGDPGDSSKFVINAALGKTVTSSYTSSSGTLASVTDGVSSKNSVPDVYYVGGGSAGSGWINIDLGRVYLVREVTVYSGYGNASSSSQKLTDFDICYSDSDAPGDAEFKTAKELRGLTAGMAAVTLDEAVPVRHLRLTSHNPTEFRLREVEVLGKRMPELPSVTLLTPEADSFAGVNQPVLFSARATYQDTEIYQVRYYLNGGLLGSADSHSGDVYTLTCPGLPAGTYTLYAAAENTDGGVGKSETVTLTVTDYALSAVRFTDGDQHGISALPPGGTVQADLTIRSYGEEGLTGAVFYLGLYNADTGILKDVTAQDFDLAAGGSADLTAKLEQLPADAGRYCVRGFLWKGKDTMTPLCAPIFLGASKPVVGAVTFEKDSYRNDEEILCSVEASDPFVGLDRVEFYLGGVLQEGEASQSGGRYTVNLGALPSGSYQVTAKAINTQGVSVSSSPAAVTVTGYQYDPDEIVLEVEKNAFNVYVKGSLAESNQYAKYHFEHIQRTDINADLYRIFRSYAARRTGNLTFEPMYGGAALIGEGEWEFAAKEVNKDDFIGGFHGDENLTNVSLALDGAAISLSEAGVYQGRSLTFIQDSVLNRCDTPAEQVGLHRKEYTVTGEGVALFQRVQWQAALELEHGYTAMLPVNRKAGAVQLTHKLQVLDPLGEVYDVPEKNAQTSGIPLTKEQAGVKKAKAWGDETGIEVTLENEMSGALPGANFAVMVRENDNKFYFDYCRKHTTQDGEVWTNTAKYQIKLTK